MSALRQWTPDVLADPAKPRQFTGFCCFGLALGALVIRRSPARDVRSIKEEYRGPRCVMCREPIERGIELCPK